MDKEIGTVINIADNEVHIEFIRSSACGSCGACMVAEDTSKMLIKVPYKRDVSIGEKVYIDIERNFYILSSVLLYVLPLAVLLATIFIGDAFIKGEFGQLLTAALAVVLSFSSYFALRVFKVKFSSMKKENISYFRV